MTAINRGLRSKRKRKELDSRISHTHTTHMPSSRKRKKLPGPSTVKEERAQFKKWEVVYVDTSGKFQVKSARGYFYSVFVDRKDVEKIAIGHDKKRHLPIAFLQYTVHVES